jgi:hypothetical protein
MFARFNMWRRHIFVHATVYKGGGHTELLHVFEHDAVVYGVEGAFEVHGYDVDVFVVDFCTFHHHIDGG